MAVSLAVLAEHVGGRIVGDENTQIESVATLQAAQSGQIAFLANSRYRKYLSVTSASAVIVTEEDAEHCQCAALVINNPYLAYARIATYLNPLDKPPIGVHESASVAEDCELGQDVSIAANAVVENGVCLEDGVVVGPGCFVGKGARIGRNSHLYANISIYHGVRIGARAIIHAGAVLGSDGFGMASDQGRWVKVPQLGSVVVADDVEIGANTTIDRGALDDTVIEQGARLDNQIQVAHNVRIGAHTAIAGCVGIAGSTHIGQRCQIGGGVGIVGHLTITDDVYITAMSLVTGNITKPGLYSSGTPLELNQSWQKNAVRFRHLDDLARRIKELERQLSEK